jgi:hypothetical protein
MEPNNSTESIDRLAQSFFMVLVFCSFVSDSYIVFENFLKNNYVQKKLNHYKKLYKVVCGLSFNNYQNDEEGNIIIDDVQNVIKDIDELSETSSISDEIIDKNIQIKVMREEEDAKPTLQSEEAGVDPKNNATPVQRPAWDFPSAGLEA